MAEKDIMLTVVGELAKEIFIHSVSGPNIDAWSSGDFLVAATRAADAAMQFYSECAMSDSLRDREAEGERHRLMRMVIDMKAKAFGIDPDQGGGLN